MARQEIILGTPPTGLGGDTPRVANSKINAMTSELYQGIGTPTSPLPVSKGGTGGTSQATAQTSLGLIPVATLSENVGGRLATTGWAGLGGALAQRAYTPDQSFNTISGGSFSYANAGGAFPSGVTDGALINMGYDTAGQFAYQILGDWRTGYLYRRGRAGGASGAWGMIYDSVNSTLDPASGGLMSSALVSGFLVSKYANGDINIRGGAPATVSIPANSFASVTIALPVALVNGALGFSFSVQVNMAPAISNDWYGVLSTSLTTTTSIGVIVRNGPTTAQTFTPNINVWGRWK
ncbi:hypothetical protein [Pseudomonas rhodesiae]|uniref:hypothetical protein n=1 Tax=Pseudomonas rhodesiae TaxID=76760 RepID=UPI00289C6885|nr:hypothetical protein [Pseudomonas rhodesiae]